MTVRFNKEKIQKLIIERQGPIRAVIIWFNVIFEVEDVIHTNRLTVLEQGMTPYPAQEDDDNKAVELFNKAHYLGTTYRFSHFIEDF